MLKKLLKSKASTIILALVLTCFLSAGTVAFADTISGNPDQPNVIETNDTLDDDIMDVEDMDDDQDEDVDDDQDEDMDDDQDEDLDDDQDEDVDDDQDEDFDDEDSDEVDDTEDEVESGEDD